MLCNKETRFKVDVRIHIKKVHKISNNDAVKNLIRSKRIQSWCPNYSEIDSEYDLCSRFERMSLENNCLKLSDQEFGFIETAIEAIEKSGLCLGILTDKGIVMAAEKIFIDFERNKIFNSEKIVKLHE
jgi:hypothetical protein